MSADFLLELLSEEVPARMQAKARNDLARMMADALTAAGLTHDGITTYSTPRRLALIARGLPLETAAVSEEIKGPKTAAPQQALDGFLRKTGLTQDQLQDRDGTWFALIDKPGRATAAVLAETVATIVRDFQWPKSMRWGAASASTASLRWVRPLHSIVALLGDAIVPVAIDGVTCGATTLGHRFHHPGPITIGGAHDYVAKLRACHVLVDQEEREAIVRKGALEAAANAGFSLVEDEGLVVENAGLTEWPVPLLGSFDADYLDVPQEVIQLTARTNQKYFVMRDGAGALAPHFICTANIDANDGGAAIIAGNERVLAARLSDARFFWQQDLKVPLESQAKKLEQIVFHEKLGSMLDKVRRTGLNLVPMVTGKTSLTVKKKAQRIARLAKADLVSGSVGEFPELQGKLGARIAAHQGYSSDVVAVVSSQYEPLGQTGQIPTNPLAVQRNIAENLDTVLSFLAIGERPSGSKDPFAIRRSALSLIRLILESGSRISLLTYSQYVLSNLGIVAATSAIKAANKRFNLSIKDAETELEFDLDDRVLKYHDQVFDLQDDIYHPALLLNNVLNNRDAMALDGLSFIMDRLKVQQREAGVRHDLIDAVFALGGEDDLVRLLDRVKALQAFVETGEGANLLAGYKRAANILKKEGWSSAPAQAGALDDGAQMSPGLRPSPERSDLESAEIALTEALDTAGPTATTAIAAEDFTAAMSALASLRAPIDAFFETVIVNDPDPAVRARRLGLLARFRDAVHAVADFSKIEG